MIYARGAPPGSMLIDVYAYHHRHQAIIITPAMIITGFRYFELSAAVITD